ncbi:MAG: gamma carbonic anhydrase family protein [Alphaproteobacteria bacterium]|nr:gamma carbonic anhydrase family protein [Alphaproteobacteria bacterium]MBU0799033.1 gamma carbonic anhydrase family protein [Alphaproteobacteria bacterium]MBU1815079.1 gamma carbonic anhydrase family protein [Alphaproteobacteria bacterium]MBU2089134.1 gamma carbonic anhydrase family protein [Alphaproteobacteria bacterium]
MAALILPHHGIVPTIDKTAFIAPNAAIIGDVEIGAESSIWFSCTLRGDVNVIRVGKRTNIQDGTILHVQSYGLGCYVGDDVTVGHAALLHACTLEDRSFVGMQACVMDGAVVETHAMVAAGSLVTPGKRVPAGQLWAGRPARYVRDLSPEDIAEISASAKRYCETAESHRQAYGQ